VEAALPTASELRSGPASSGARWGECASSSGASAFLSESGVPSSWRSGRRPRQKQIALCSLQIRAIRNDPAFAGGDYYGTGARPVDGLPLARGIGQVSYRTAGELQSRFGEMRRGKRILSRAVDSRWSRTCSIKADKLVARFDPNSYIVLSEAMNHHDVGRGRGGAEQALSTVRAEVTVAGIASDRLYPLALQQELARCSRSDRPVAVVESAISVTTGSFSRPSRSET
jgi:homoserine O-acetyltransferase